jgi:hypothetical protein
LENLGIGNFQGFVKGLTSFILEQFLLEFQVAPSNEWVHRALGLTAQAPWELDTSSRGSTQKDPNKYYCFTNQIRGVGEAWLSHASRVNKLVLRGAILIFLLQNKILCGDLYGC